MAVTLEALQAIPYFSGVEVKELESLKQALFEKAVPRGEIVLVEGEKSNLVYFVVSGVVKLFKTSPDGKEQIIYLVRPYESFNEIPVFEAGLALASAQAMTPVVLYAMEKDDLKSAVAEHPSLAKNIIQVLAQRSEQLLSLVEDLSFRRVTSRVAKILLENLSERERSPRRLTQQEMAAMAGTAREMIGRSLKVLEEEGKIRLDRNRIVITDKEALKESAGIGL
jgi:CRP/FNR family transcriptional regulator